MQISLPFPPSLNHYYRHVGAKTLISRDGRAYRKTVAALLAARRVKPLDGDIEISIMLYPPDRRRRDVDNSLKALLDALEHGGAYHDDSQIVRLVIEKHVPMADGKVVLDLRRKE